MAASSSQQQPVPIGGINFVGSGLPGEPAKFCVVDDGPVDRFGTDQFLKDFNLSHPEVLISITGSAIPFTLRHSKLEQIFNRGLVRAAESANAWIITGGSDSGVMKLVGAAIRGPDQRALVPCIGIASLSKVSNRDILDDFLPQPSLQKPIDYVPGKEDDSAALNPDHTHFMLYKSKDAKSWNQEIRFRTKFEGHISKKLNIPVVLVAINGGPGTVETVFEGISKKFPIIIVEGSGRASDAMAAYIRNTNIELWEQFRAETWPQQTPDEKKKFDDNLTRLRNKKHLITIFNPNDNETEDMDKAILRSIFFKCRAEFEHKLTLGAKWGRADLLEELLQEHSDLATVQKKVKALSAALSESLKRDKPEIYELLRSKGAGLEEVNIEELYEIAHKQIVRLVDAAGLSANESVTESTPPTRSNSFVTDSTPPTRSNSFVTESTPPTRRNSIIVSDENNTFRDNPGDMSLHKIEISQEIKVENSGVTDDEDTKIQEDNIGSKASRKGKEPDSTSPRIPGKGTTEKDRLLDLPQSPKNQRKIDKIKQILRKIHRKYENILKTSEVTETDILIWAIMADRFELAKAVWRRTRFTVHSALIACHLYKALGEWLLDEIYKEQYTWFENSAIAVLSELTSENAEKVLDWKWAEVDDASSLAAYAECKNFFATPHVQHYLDIKFYSRGDKNVQLVQGTKVMAMLAMIVFPFTIGNSGKFGAISGNSKPHFGYFYKIPIVKLLSSSISYVLFLMLLIVNLVKVDPTESVGESRFEIMWYEWLLWLWLFSALVEEYLQYRKEPSKHFSQISNRMDLVMYVLLCGYFVLRILAWYIKSQALLLGFTDVLVIATIVCFLRFMNVFAVSKSLGPLYFVIIRLFSDVIQWLIIFILFMLSFQAGIFAFTRQAGESGWKFFPGGSMGTGFTAILGDLGDHTMQWMTETRLGVILVLLYSLIAQVMLVNLLIAMMGSTYTAVKDNSDKEWKFYRYQVLNDYRASSSCPPPLIIPYLVILRCIKFLSSNPSQNTEKQDLLEATTMISKILKVATERVIEKEEANRRDALPAVSGFIHEQVRLLPIQRDSDRAFMEQLLDSKMQQMDTKMQQMDNKMQQMDNKMQKLDDLERKIQDVLDILRSQPTKKIDKYR